MPKLLAAPLGRSFSRPMIMGKERRTGRPPKGAEKRRHKVTVALNDQEYDQVSLKAGLTPFTISEYCRKAALRHQVREALSHEERQLLRDLYKMGINLNRLVTWLERGNLNEVALEIIDIQKEFTGINRYFREVLRHGR